MMPLLVLPIANGNPPINGLFLPAGFMESIDVGLRDKRSNLETNGIDERIATKFTADIVFVSFRLSDGLLGNKLALS
jgi:hypothetical protein